jgi:hypothetical protein
MRERDAVEVPCAIEIILRPGARDQRVALIVHEHHFIAFPHPVVLILQDPQSHSHQVPASARFGKNVVFLAIEILQLVGIAIGPPIVGRGLVRRGLAVLRVEVEHLVRQRGHDLVIDVGIECVHSPPAFVGGGNARRLAERHGEVTVQCLH